MYHHLRSLLILIFISLLFSCKSEPTFQIDRKKIVDSTILSYQQNYYKEKIDSIIAAHKFWGAVSIKQNDAALYENYSGFSNIADQKLLDSNSVFAIASVSKQFTAVLLHAQEEAGNLHLSDKVSKYLPELRNKELDEITIQQILNHTSGLNDFGERLQSAPGTEYHYSNKGYTILGEVLEVASNQSYDQLLNSLFEKAGMRHSGSATNFQGLPLVSFYVGNRERHQIVNGMPSRLATKNIGVPAGGILSNCNDLHRWNAALYEGKIFGDSSLQTFMSQSSVRDHYLFDKVGYGDGIMMNLQAPSAYFHTGYVKGAPSLLIYYPDTKTSVVILSNIANEALGKKAFFKTHKFIKELADEMENKVVYTRKVMLSSQKL